MADRVAVFNRGRIEQLDTPRELYTRPRTAFVARFVGSANVVDRRAGAASQRARRAVRGPRREHPVARAGSALPTRTR